jgi:glucose-1-phosphate cytidylyltransferase
MTAMNNEFQQVPVVILCGGHTVMLDQNQTERLNKALVPVNGKPLFAWVIRHYAQHGASDFVLAAGVQVERFGKALEQMGASSNGDSTWALPLEGRDCNVRVVGTGAETTTAGRLLACKPYVEQAERFALTYSDTLSNVDLSAEMRFHKKQGLVATLVGTRYPVRFRILGIRYGESQVRAFAPRPVIEAASINGGYYIFSQGIWDAKFGVEPGVAFENKPLELLASGGQLAAFEHKGAWQHCDSERDLGALVKLAQ